MTITRGSIVVHDKLALTLGHLPGLGIRPMRLLSIRTLRSYLHARCPSVLMMGPAFNSCFSMIQFHRRAAKGKVQIITLIDSFVSTGLLDGCSSSVSVFSSLRALSGGVAHLRGVRPSARRSKRRALDRQRGRVIIYMIGKVAGGRVTRGLFLSVRAMVAREEGVDGGLRVRDTTNLAVCTVMGGLIRLDSIGSL